jgi:competence protein ComEC
LRVPRLTHVERAAVVGLVIVAGIVSSAIASATGRETRFTVLDVGQGDAILVESATGARMMVDGGPDPDRVLLALDERIPPWDRRLDVVVLTHPHEDHVAGLARLLARYAVGRVFEPGMRGPGPGWATWDAVLHDGPPRALLQTGAHLRIGEIALTVLWPDPGAVPLEPPDTGTAINNVSIVFLGEANGRRFLLMGDVEQGIDPGLLARGLPRVDVLKIAHHGSRTATSQAFVDAVRPSVAIASAGAGNPYGHPAKATLDRLRAAGASVYRTDQDGSVEVDVRRSGVIVHASGASAVGRGVATKSLPLAEAARRGLLCAIPIEPGSPVAIPADARRVPGGIPIPGTQVIRAAGSDPSAWATTLGYDPPHDRPGAPRGRPPAALPGSPALGRHARVRGGGRGGVARHARSRARRVPRPGHRRGGRAPPRHRQGQGGACAVRPPPRRRLGRAARGPRMG